MNNPKRPHIPVAGLVQYGDLNVHTVKAGRATN